MNIDLSFINKTDIEPNVNLQNLRKIVLKNSFCDCDDDYDNCDCEDDDYDDCDFDCDDCDCDCKDCYACDCDCEIYYEDCDYNCDCSDDCYEDDCNDCYDVCDY